MKHTAEETGPMSHQKRKHAYVRTPKRHQLSRSRKLLFSGVTTLVVFASMEIVLWCCRVEPAFVTEDPYAGFSRHIPHFVSDNDGDDGVLLTVAPTKIRVLNPQRFSAAKPKDVYRIVCLGGSTTYGRPFFDQTSFPGWLRELLPVAQPSRRWEVINAGGISYASYRDLGVMEELAQYAPNLFIVYTGQNEFLEQRTYRGLSDSNSWLTGPLSLVFRTRTATAVRDVLDFAGIRRSQANHRAPVLGDATKAIPIDSVGPASYKRDEALKKRIVEHFQATLLKMVHVAEQSKADILFVVPASNLSDFAPFRSQHRSGLSDADLANWDLHERQARALNSDGNHEAALAEINQSQAIDDRYAALWFLKGQVLEILGRFDEAKEALKRARDEDVCPLRAIEPLVQIVRRLPEFTGKPVVDFEVVAERHCEHGLLGEALFHDHVHPTVEANQLLALAILDELQNRGILQPDSSWGEEAISRVTEHIHSKIDRPLHAKQLRMLASMMGWLKQSEAARRQAELSLDLSGRTEPALLELAGGLQANGATNLALEYFQAAVQVAPTSAQASFRLADCALDAGSEELGIRQLRMAVQLDPSLVEARVRLSVALATQGHFQQAEQHLSAAVLLKPDSATIYNNLGLIMAKQGRYSEAVVQYQKSLSLHSNDSSTHYNAGLAFEKLGQLEEAKSHFEATIHLSNGHANAKSHLQALRKQQSLLPRR